MNNYRLTQLIAKGFLAYGVFLFVLSGCGYSGSNGASNAVPPNSQGLVIYDCSSNQIHCVDNLAGSNQEYSSIQTAVNISQPGDTVVVYDGNYDGFRVSSSGTSAQRITVVAQFSGTRITSSEPFGQNAIRIQDASYVTIRGFNIDWAGSSSNTSYDYACIAARGASVSSPMRGLSFINNHLLNCAPAGMYLSNAQNLTIVGNTVKNTRDVGGNSGMGIYLANSGVQNALVVENVISGNGSLGIHMNGDSSVGGSGVQRGHIIQRNVFDSNGTNALNMDGVQDLRIENNIMSNNIKHGIRGYRIDGGGGPQNWLIVNNTFYNNESPVKTTEDSGGHVIFNNIIVDNTNNSLLLSAGNYSDNNNLISTSQNTIFANAPGDDLRLKSGSPAINGGVGSFSGESAPVDDLSSAPRSGPPDTGAFESGSSYPPWSQ